jgi:hypothetical protein
VGPYLEDNLSDVAALVEHGGQLLPLPAGRQVQHVEGVVVGGPVSIIATHQVDLNMCGEDMVENQLCYICSELAYCQETKSQHNFFCRDSPVRFGWKWYHLMNHF